ncbi:MAG: hypothetical protein AB8B69_19865 [Chitinophagales bacterium]
MDAILFNAIIGGVLSLIGIYVKHRLDKRNEITSTSNVENRDAAEYDSPSIFAKLFNSDMKRGLKLLGLNAVTIVVFVNVFDLNNNAPFWEDLFAVIVLGMVPVYAMYLVIRGFFQFFLE